MANITISDLELAPALADDMVLPVENTTDTYAATLAMLRRLINKTFVEVEDANFNDLTDDGFYQCTGTPTNSPEAGEINWTLQVSAESGVVVQRAFSLDDNFANIYIRRFNGVTWTGWLEVGARALANKANVDLDNLSTAGLNILNKIVPAGLIINFGGTQVPNGYLLCNGGIISRTTYADLFSVIGTTYGAGDGSTTFNLPDFRDRIAQGSGTRGNVGTYKTESLPNITGVVGFSDARTNYISGAFTARSIGVANSAYTGNTQQYVADFSASSSSATYQNGASVQQNALLILCCIKY